jgi:hypothetical protein
MHRLGGRRRTRIDLSERRSPFYREPDNRDREDYFFHSEVPFHAIPLSASDPSYLVSSAQPSRFPFAVILPSMVGDRPSAGSDQDKIFKREATAQLVCEEAASVERKAGLPPLRFSKSLCYMAGMKSRYIAALALVGWYLIAPSVYRRDPVHGKPAYAGVNEPMSAWTTFGSYDSAEKCEAARHAQFDGVAPSGDDLDRALYESAAKRNLPSDGRPASEGKIGGEATPRRCARFDGLVSVAATRRRPLET